MDKAAIPLGFQHASGRDREHRFPALLVANTANMAADQKIMLVQVSLLMTAVAILLQLFPIVRDLVPACPW